MNIANKKGFTLVEVVVAAVLLAVLALGVYALFIMYLSSTRETVASLRMQRQSEILMEEIARQTRVANVILPVEQTWAQYTVAVANPTVPIPAIQTNNITFFNSDGTMRAGFRVINSVIQECVPGTPAPGGGATALVCNNFVIDGVPITLAPDVTDQIFEVLGNRVELEVRMTLRTEVNGNPFNLFIERGTFRCRL